MSESDLVSTLRSAVSGMCSGMCPAGAVMHCLTRLQDRISRAADTVLASADRHAISEMVGSAQMPQLLFFLQVHVTYLLTGQSALTPDIHDAMRSLSFDDVDIESAIQDSPLLSYSTADLVQIVACTLRLCGSICYSSVYNSQYLMSTLQFGHMVVPLLQAPHDAIRSAACVAAGNIITSDRSQIDHIYQQCIPPLIMLMSDGSDSVRLEASWTLYWLVKSGSFVHVKHTLTCNIIPALLLNPIPPSNDALISVTLDLLVELIKFGRVTSTEGNVCVVWMRQLGAEDYVSQYTNHHIDDIRMSSHVILNGLAVSGASAQSSYTQQSQSADDLLAALVDNLTL